MNLDAAAEWVRDHKAAAAAAAGSLLIVVLWLHHRAKTQTASDTAGVNGATTGAGGQYLVPYDGTSDYTQTDPAVTTALTNLTTGIAGITAAEQAQTGILQTISKTLAPGVGSSLSAHQLHELHVKHQKGHPTSTAGLSAHQLHELHLQHQKGQAPAANPPRKPHVAGAAVGANTGLTNAPRVASIPAGHDGPHPKAPTAHELHDQHVAHDQHVGRARPGARLPVALAA